MNSMTHLGGGLVPGEACGVVDDDVMKLLNDDSAGIRRFGLASATGPGPSEKPLGLHAQAAAH
jgi:hypothetical protein